MGEAIAFDTLRFVKRLTEHGLTEEQAEALANRQVNLLNGNLATKAGIEAVQRGIEVLRQKTKAGIEALEQATRADVKAVQRDIEALQPKTRAGIAALEADLLKWTFGAMIAQGGPIAALVELP